MTIIIDSSNYGVSESNSDNHDAIINAVNALPAAGGIVLLPASYNLQLAQPLVISHAGVTLRGQGKHVTNIVSASALNGDVITLTGEQCKVESLSFYSQGGIRSSGYTVAMNGAWQSIDGCAINDGYISIKMASNLGACWVQRCEINNMSNAAGSGGIEVNGAIGPDNYITDTTINNGTLPSGASDFGIRLLNTGATHISNLDILGMRIDLLVNPGTNQTVQATIIENTYFDSAQQHCVQVSPTGQGFVYDFRMTDCWCTNNTTSGASGILIVTNSTSGSDTARAVQSVKLTNGFIISNTAEVFGTLSGEGITLAGGGISNVLIDGNTIAGYNIGINSFGYSGQSSGPRSLIIKNNMSGRYNVRGLTNPGDIAETNGTGINLDPSTGDFVICKNNLVNGNITSGVSWSAGSNTHWIVNENLG